MLLEILKIRHNLKLYNSISRVEGTPTHTQTKYALKYECQMSDACLSPCTSVCVGIKCKITSVDSKDAYYSIICNRFHCL